MMPPPIRQRLGALFVLPMLVGAASGCDIALGKVGQRETAEWRKSYELRPGGQVEITNVNGKIDVVPGEGNTVEVLAVKSAGAANVEAAKQTLGRIEIREASSADGIKIETRFDRQAGLFSRANWQVQYTVKVPRNAVLKLVTVNGGVEITGVSGRITAETTNGGVKARDIGGMIEASTTNGGVEVELSKVHEGGVKLECTNGGISLDLPAGASASISARMTNGGIDTGGLALQTRGESSRRRLEGDLNGGGPRITLEGTNGGINIRGR